MPIKMMFCLKRRQGLSREEFQRYWLEDHAAKVRRIGPASGMVRYVQCHTYDSPIGAGAARARGTGPDFDGIMEGWWESEDAARAAFRAMDPAGGEELLTDERRFIDLAGSSLFMTREHIIY